MQKITFFFILILFTSCEKKISDLDFERNVMSELFPTLIDQTCVDTRLFRNPPPKYGNYIYDVNGTNIGIDTSNVSDSERKKMQDWKRERDKILKDTSSIIIAFNPNINDNPENVEEDFKKHFPNAQLSKSKGEKYILDYKNITLNDKYKLKNIKDFPERNDDDFWQKKYGFVFSGIVSFTRIRFDENKKFGVLDAGFVCGNLCGQGYRIFIKNENGKWIIDEIQGTWVS
jgi:hypothetical protein